MSEKLTSRDVLDAAHELEGSSVVVGEKCGERLWTRLALKAEFAAFLCDSCASSLSRVPK